MRMVQFIIISFLNIVNVLIIIISENDKIQEK